jgi:hypothetical protein
MADIDQDVRYTQDGEAQAAEVFNRPTKDLALAIDEKFVEASDESLSNAIVFAIALGG